MTIWSLLRPEDDHGNSLKEVAGIRFVDRRRDAFSRQKAQQGVFTQVRGGDIDLLDHVVRREQPTLLARFDLPATEALEALAELRLMNITYATLFPDATGAATQANVDDLFHELLRSAT